MTHSKTRSLAGFGIFVVGVLFFFWWIAPRPVSPESPVPSGSSPASANTAADVRPLRLGLNIAAGSALHAAAVKFAERVGERSKGKLKITVFPDQQLGSDDQMLEMARNGTLDLVLTPTAKLSSAIPAMQYADLPFYFTSREELYSMLDGAPGKLLLSKLKSIDLVGLTFWENGFKQFTANTPIRSPRDFAKLRIRTMKSPLIAEQFSSLGAQPIPIDFHATYKALAEGAVDGQENPLVAIVAMRFHEVQKHLTLSNHAYLGYVFSASKRVFETLPPESREIILDTARELTVWEREETARREADFIEVIRAAGVSVYTLTPEERQRFSAALAPIAEKFGFDVGYDLLAKTEELRFTQQAVKDIKDTKGTIGTEPLVIGLDADLSAGGAQGGGAIYRGMQLAIEEINKKGGLLGRPVKIIARDHASLPQIGRQNLEHFAEMPSLLAVMGGMHGSVIFEELDDIHRMRLPYLIPWSAAGGLIQHDYRPSYTFRLSISDTQVAPFLLERALKLGDKLGILLERSAWGRSNEAALKPLIEKLPGGSAEIIWFDVGDTAIESRIDTLVSAGTDVILMVANPMEARTIVKAMAKQEKPIPIVSHWGLTGGDFFTPLQSALQRVNLQFAQSILLDEGGQQHPNLGKFLKRYRERYGLLADAPLPSPIGSLHAYDLTLLFAQAVRQAKTTDRAAIRNALESLPSYSGVLRDYNPPFTRDRHEALDRSLLHMGRFDTRGRIVRVD